MSDEAPTFRTFVATFADFLTVAIHVIIYERAVYPESSFLSARKYNFAVRQSRHPKVCEWINDAVLAVESELLKGSVERVAVVMYNKQNKPLERFVFDVSRFPTVPTLELDVPLERISADGNHSPVLPLVDMEEQCRAALSRLSNCSTGLTPLPKGCTFTIAVELKSGGQAPLGHPQPWIPSESAPERGESASEAQTITMPVRAVAAGYMVFESWIEELCEKISH